MQNLYFLERVEGVGIIDGEEARNQGLSGPMLRAFEIIQWDHYQIENVECDDKEEDSLAHYFVRSEIISSYGPLN